MCQSVHSATTILYFNKYGRHGYTVSSCPNTNDTVRQGQHNHTQTISKLFQKWSLDNFDFENIPETARHLQLVTTDKYERMNSRENRRLAFGLSMANSDDPPACALDYIDLTIWGYILCNQSNGHRI